MATKVEPAPVRHPLDSKALPKFVMSHPDPATDSTPRKTSDVSRGLLREDSSGILSSLMTVAHSAANMMKPKNGASIESSGETPELKSPETPKKNKSTLMPVSSNSGLSVAYSRSTKSTPDRNSLSTSNVHFEPVHSSPIHTLGTGDLSLVHFEKERAAQSESAEKRGSFMTETHPTKLLVSGAPDSKVVRRKSISNVSMSESLSSENTIDTDGADNHTYNPSEFSTSELDQLLEFPNKHHVQPKKDREFHSIFKKIPPNEHLLADFSCALSRDILVQGKMYLSPHYICFKSNILGWVTNIMIPIAEIIQIEKKSTAVLFPNGMVIRTLHQKFVFATFLSRDATFDMITRVWHNALQNNDSGDSPRNKRNLKMERSRTSTVGSDISNGIHTNDLSSGSEEDIDSLGSSDENLSTFMSRSSERSRTQRAKKSQNLDNITRSDSISDEELASLGFESPSSKEKKGNLFKGFVNPGPQIHAPTSFEREKMDGEVEIIAYNFNAPMGVIFNILYGPDNSTFIRILEEGKNFDISKEKITEINDRHKEREYSYIKPLSGPIGPKQTKCNLTERLIKQDFSSFCALEQVTKTPDVPSGNSFKVKTAIYFSWGPKNTTDMTVYTSIEWSAKSWIKSAVEKGSLEGQKSSMKILTDTVSDIISNGVPGASKKKRKRTKSDNKPVKTLESTQIDVKPAPLSSQIVQILDQVGMAIPVQIPFVSTTVTGACVLFLGSLLYTYVLTFLTGGRSPPNLTISNNGKHVSMSAQELYMLDDELRRKNEAQLWEWIRARTGSSEPIKDGDNILNKKYYDENFKKYSDENFKEMMRLTKERVDAAYMNLI